MPLSHLTSKLRSHSVHRSSSVAHDESFYSSVMEKTQNELNSYKATRKLPMLGVQWHLVKDLNTPGRSGKFRSNLIGQYSGKSFSVLNDNGDGMSSGGDSEVNLDNMIRQFEMMQNKTQKVSSINIRDRATSLDRTLRNHQETNLSLRSDDKNHSDREITSSKSPLGASPGQNKQATIGAYPRPSKFSYQSASTYYSSNQVRDHEHSTEKKVASLKRRNNETQAPQKHVLKPIARLGSARDLSFQDEEVAQFQLQHARPMSPRKLFKKDVGGESKVPLVAIRDLTILKAKVAYPQRKILAKPLNLPLTEQMETTLKRIDSESKNSKRSKKSLTKLREYESSLLKKTFKEYFHKINPIGRIQNEEDLEMMNKIETTFRSKRGLKVNVNVEVEDKEKSKDSERPYNLMTKLKQAQNNEGKSKEILKKYREDRPNEMRKQFLEQSFYGVLKKTPKEKESVNASEKMKKYDAWYVPPKQRSKRFLEVLEHSYRSNSTLNVIEERNSLAYE